MHQLLHVHGSVRSPTCIMTAVMHRGSFLPPIRQAIVATALVAAICYTSLDASQTNRHKLSVVATVGKGAKRKKRWRHNWRSNNAAAYARWRHKNYPSPWELVQDKTWEWLSAPWPWEDPSATAKSITTLTPLQKRSKSGYVPWSFKKRALMRIVLILATVGVVIRELLDGHMV